MELFTVTKFDDDKVADGACKELFSKSFSFSKKKNNFNLEKGKVIKKRKKKKAVNADNKEIVKKIISAQSKNNSQDSNTLNLIKNKELLKKRKKKLQKKPETLKPTVPEEMKNDETTLKNKTVVHKKEKDLKKSKKKIKNIENTTYPQDKNEKRLKKNFKTSLKNFNPKIDKKHNAEKNKKQQKTNCEASSKSNIPRNDEEHKSKLSYKQRKRQKFKEKLQEIIQTSSTSENKKSTKSLRERMMEQLQAARFRYINQQIYSSDSKEAQKLFSSDPETFNAYHEGYRQQVNKWPLNPLDVIIENIQKLPKTMIVADFGCGDAKLAKSVEHKVHSFDLVARNELVTACDMAHVPLQKNSVDVVVFCLSLMGTNLNDYILEANRVLKGGGILKIAEVESRFEDVNQFIEAVKRFHFKHTWQDLSHNLFYFLDFKKESNIKNKKKLPVINLNPCLYKKR